MGPFCVFLETSPWLVAKLHFACLQACLLWWPHLIITVTPYFPRSPGSWDWPLCIVLPTVSWENFSQHDPAQLSHEVFGPFEKSYSICHVKFWKRGCSNTALPLLFTVVGATSSFLLRWGKSSTLPCKGENEAHHTEISPRKPQSLHFLSIAWWVFMGGLWYHCSPILGHWSASSLTDRPLKLTLKIQLCAPSFMLLSKLFSHKFKSYQRM